MTSKSVILTRLNYSQMVINPYSGWIAAAILLCGQRHLGLIASEKAVMTSILNIVNRGEKFTDTGDNKWNWVWLDYYVEHSAEDRETVRHAFRKVDRDSTAWCSVCNVEIDYGRGGWKCLRAHMETKKHKKRRNALKNNTTLPGKSHLQLVFCYSCCVVLSSYRWSFYSLLNLVFLLQIL